MYKVIGGKKSRTLRVMWMLEELGQTYEHVDAAPRSDEVKAHHSSGKIPVLMVDEVALTDSTAILTFLADKHQALTHAPGTIERARQDGVTQFVLDEMDAILWTAARHSFILPEDRRVPEIKDSLKWEFATSVERFMEKLGDKPFVMGDMMTVPDLIAAHCGSWATGAKFPIENEAFAAYVKRLQDRPAFRAALAA
ncbi:glutathione S-transferase family protein [Anianabacter salinae]|uniref:glutathione S-transferase family protein n=1 Tax=Anianabacter salinae TaxID=2851023 RepID=UPI00225E5229|nr:glutathione S-transferase [Anianabacter salinae]MBV0913658.1 glutathione S-transferase [Anianabacter salinae]